MKAHRQMNLRCTRCMDGDTIRATDGENDFDIRLLGIDAPERGQPHYRSAKIYLESLVCGKEIKARAIAKDRYGRFVCWVHIDEGLDVSLEMLRHGLAWYYSPKQLIPQYRLVQDLARDERVGIWGFENPKPPWEWRKIELEKQLRANMTPLP